MVHDGEGEGFGLHGGGGAGFRVQGGESAGFRVQSVPQGGPHRRRAGMVRHQKPETRQC